MLDRAVKVIAHQCKKKKKKMMQNVKRTLMDQPVMAIRSIAKSKVGGKCIITRCKNWSVSNPSEVTYLSIAKLD